MCGRGFLRQSNLDLHAVMHQTGPKEGGLRRGRPKPKKKQADAEMREFVANVLSSVKKVDSGMQTENFVNGIPADSENSQGADNLSAFVNFAVEQDNKTTKLDTISDLQNESNGDQQFTLVMQDDGSGGYLISNYDGSAVPEEIVNSLPSQQVEVSSGYHNTTSAEEEIVKREENFDESQPELVVNTSEKVVYATDIDDSGCSSQTVSTNLDAAVAEGDIILQEVGNLAEDGSVQDGRYIQVVLEDGTRQNIVVKQKK